MTVRHAGTYGGATGLLLGIVVVLVCNVPIAEAAYRLLALAMCGALMGAMLVWLDTLLPRAEERKPTEAGRWQP